MHEVQKTDDGVFRVVTYDIVMNGGKIERRIIEVATATKRSAAATALMSRGVTQHEAFRGLNDMEMNGHKIASYGALGSFIFSSNE